VKDNLARFSVQYIEEESNYLTDLLEPYIHGADRPLLLSPLAIQGTFTAYSGVILRLSLNV
jgi:hypothetical protein